MAKLKPPSVESPIPEPPYKTTGINLPADIWELLNRVAFERAKERGGRPSVSALLVDLVQRHRKELERELQKSRRARRERAASRRALFCGERS